MVAVVGPWSVLWSYISKTKQDGPIVTMEHYYPILLIVILDNSPANIYVGARADWLAEA